jgi:putative transcriptional regulator
MIKIIFSICISWYCHIVIADDVIEIQNTSNNYIYATKNDTIFKQRPQLSKGIFLIAGKNLKDPNFNKTVILITDFNETGTTGLIINRPTEILLDQVLPQFSAWSAITKYLNIGGPVAVNTFSLLVRSDSELPPVESRQVFDNVYLVNTLEMLNQIPNKDSNKSFFKLYVGYSGWAAGQLETELLRGDWHIWHADEETIFDTGYEEIWRILLELASAKWAMLKD